MKATVGKSLFSGYKVGDGIGVMISHLQFGDDILLICDKSWDNIRSLKADIIIFEVISELKVNFRKSQLVQVNVYNSWLVEASTLLNCKTWSLPFFLFGSSYIGDSRKLNILSLLVNRSKSRLSIWKSRNLFIGGRLVLLKFALSSILVYFLSFFKASAYIISSIEFILKCFYGGRGVGSEDFRKIT